MKEPIRIDIDSDNIFLLIWEDGYAWLDIYKYPEKDRTYITNIEVHPQRHGIGRRTLQWLLANGYKNLEPEAVKSTAYGFWEQMEHEGLIVDLVRI